MRRICLWLGWGAVAAACVYISSLPGDIGSLLSLCLVPFAAALFALSLGGID